MIASTAKLQEARMPQSLYILTFSITNIHFFSSHLVTLPAWNRVTVAVMFSGTDHEIWPWYGSSNIDSQPCTSEHRRRPCRIHTIHSLCGCLHDKATNKSAKNIIYLTTYHKDCTQTFSACVYLHLGVTKLAVKCILLMPPITAQSIHVGYTRPIQNMSFSKQSERRK